MFLRMVWLSTSNGSSWEINTLYLSSTSILICALIQFPATFLKMLLMDYLLKRWIQSPAMHDHNGWSAATLIPMSNSRVFLGRQFNWVCWAALYTMDGLVIAFQLVLSCGISSCCCGFFCILSKPRSSFSYFLLLWCFRISLFSFVEVTSIHSLHGLKLFCILLLQQKVCL